METRYRVAELRAWGCDGGYTFSALVLVAGRRRWVRGKVNTPKELEGALMSQVAAFYLEVTGQPLAERPV